MSMAERIATMGLPQLAFGNRILCPAIALFASLLLGGGTKAGFLSDALLQAVCIPLLLLAIYRWVPYERGQAGAGDARMALGLIGFLVALFLIQLVPLPPGVWTLLPGRQAIAETWALTGRERPWLPLTVAPDATWFALLSLIPSVAVFLGALQLGYGDRRRIMIAFVVFGTCSAFLGLLQVAQGETSRLRPFEFTNLSEAVGLFANRNHFATLLCTTMVPAAVLAALASERLSGTASGPADYSRAIVAAMASFITIMVLFSAIVMARSRAGLGLMLVAIFAGVVLTAPMAKLNRKNKGNRWLLVAGFVVAMMLAGQFALFRMLERFATDPGADGRIPFARNTIEAAKAFMPFGSGIGTFVPVYGTYEKVDDAYASYANRAHNDFLEAWLETGAFGIILLTVFLAWLILRAMAIWGKGLSQATRTDVLLARAALVVVLLIVVHSLLDYPLRTGAISSLFAFCCALLLPPPAPLQQQSDSEEFARHHAVRRERHAVPERPLSPMVPAASAEPAPWQEHPQRWVPPASTTVGAPNVAAPLPLPAGPPPLPGITAAQQPVSPAASAAQAEQADWLVQVAAATSTGQPGTPPTQAPRGSDWTDAASWPEQWRARGAKDKPPDPEK